MLRCLVGAVGGVVYWFVVGLDATLAADMGNVLSDLREYGLMFLGVLLIFGIPWLAIWAFWHYIVMRIAMERT